MVLFMKIEIKYCQIRNNVTQNNVVFIYLYIDRYKLMFPRFHKNKKQLLNHCSKKTN